MMLLVVGRLPLLLMVEVATEVLLLPMVLIECLQEALGEVQLPWQQRGAREKSWVQLQ